MEGESRLPIFNDPDARNELGFSSSHRFGRRILPGTTWESGNMFDAGMQEPNLNMEDGVFNDIAWRFGVPAKLEVFREGEAISRIFYSDASRRLQAVEQLTLPPEYSTIPNTAAF